MTGCHLRTEGIEELGITANPGRRHDSDTEATGRFTRHTPEALEHEERGLGWRATWREGAESLKLEREAVEEDQEPALPGGS